MYRSASGAVERSTEEPSSSSTRRLLVSTHGDVVGTTVPGSTLREVGQHRELVAVRLARGEPVERLLLAHRADPARNALPAGLVTEELGDAQHRVDEVGALVVDDHDARAERRTRRARVLERERKVQ